MMNLDDVVKRIERCPANAWLGLKPIALDDDCVTFDIPVRPEMAGNPDTGAMHGGMIAALVDTLCSYAWLVQNPGSVMTVDMRIDFHRPILVSRLIGRGPLVRSGRRIVTADAEICDPEGMLLASGRAVMILVQE
jgi:uncharacterized protein (TIGR00369 family)